MGKLKDKMIDDMNPYEMQEYLNNCKSDHDLGYIEFLEQHLEEAEIKIDKYKSLLKAKIGPGYCVECFEFLPKGEIICGKCQDESDGRWDHLRNKD